MTSFYDSYDYYKKMQQLQERLRKSEEDRIKLEGRCKTLMQESRNRHYSCINRLRLRYIEFLKEQHKKDERNYKLLETLNSVDNSLLLMTAQINRLNVLKKQYEEYHPQTYIVNPSTNMINDTYTKRESKNSDLKRNISVKSIPFSAPNLIKKTNDKYDDSDLKGTTEFKSLHQQINDNQNMLQTRQVYPQSVTQNLPLQNLPSQRLQYKSPHYQIDSDMYSPPRLSNIPSKSLDYENISYFSKSPTRQTSNNNVARYKLLDVPKSQSRLGRSQDYINSSLGMQSLQSESNGTSLSDTHTRISDVSEKLLNYRPSKIIERSVPRISLFNRFSNISQHTSQNYLNHPLKNNNYLQKSTNNTPIHSPTTSKIDAVQENERRTAMIVEDELERYIDKIRKLHSDLDVQSLSGIDHEQNTNDGTLNDISLDRDLELLPENQSNENILKGVKKVLALADDLASKSGDLNDGTNSGNENRDKNEILESSMHREQENPATFEEDESNIDDLLEEPRFDSQQSIEKPEEQNVCSVSNTHTPVQYEQQSSNIQEKNIDSTNNIVERNDKNATLEDMPYEEYHKEHGVYVSKESKLDQCVFETVKELQPWNLNLVQKQIMELNVAEEDGYDSNARITELNQDNIHEAEATNEVINEEILENQMGQQEFEEDTNIKETEVVSSLQHEQLEYVDPYTNDKNIIQNTESTSYTYDEQGEFANEQKEECYESNQTFDANEQEQGNEQEIVMQDEGDSVETCVDGSNQTQNYIQNFETKQFNLNENYSYQNTSYENNQDQNYDQNVSPDDGQQQEYKEYIQGSNEQHEQYSNNEYDNYSNDPENRYEQTFNAENQENLDQQYVYDQQSEQNQAMAETNMNQNIEYENTCNFNQSHTVQEEGDKENCDYEQLQQKEDQTLEEFGGSENKSIKPSAENETSKEDINKFLLDSDTETSIERNISNTASDFDFN